MHSAMQVDTAAQDTPAARILDVMRVLDFWCQDLTERGCSPTATDALTLLNVLLSKGAPRLYEDAKAGLDER